MLYSLCWEVFAHFGIGKGSIYGPKIVFEKFLSKFSMTKVKDYLQGLSKHFFKISSLLFNLTSECLRNTFVFAAICFLIYHWPEVSC